MNVCEKCGRSWKHMHVCSGPAAAKTTGERVAALRAARDARGLRRLEVYAHPDDWPAIKALAEKLQRRRQRAEKRAA